MTLSIESHIIINEDVKTLKFVRYISVITVSEKVMTDRGRMDIGTCQLFTSCNEMIIN